MATSAAPTSAAAPITASATPTPSTLLSPARLAWSSSGRSARTYRAHSAPDLPAPC